MVNAMQEREDNDWCWVCNESLWCRCGTTLAIFVQHQILLVFIFGDSFLTLKHFLLAVGCYYFEILDQSWNSVTVNWELFFCKFININWPSWFALVLKSSSLLNLFFKHLFLLKLFCTLCQLQYCQYGTRIYFEIWSNLIVVSLIIQIPISGLIIWHRCQRKFNIFVSVPADLLHWTVRCHIRGRGVLAESNLAVIHGRAFLAFLIILYNILSTVTVQHILLLILRPMWSTTPHQWNSLVLTW